MKAKQNAEKQLHLSHIHTQSVSPQMALHLLNTASVTLRQRCSEGGSCLCRGPHTAPAFPRDPCPPSQECRADIPPTEHNTSSSQLPSCPIPPQLSHHSLELHVKSAEAHWNKHCNSYGTGEKRASFHNSSSPLRTTLLY